MNLAIPVLTRLKVNIRIVVAYGLRVQFNLITKSRRHVGGILSQNI